MVKSACARGRTTPIALSWLLQVSTHSANLFSNGGVFFLQRVVDSGIRLQGGPLCRCLEEWPLACASGAATHPGGGRTVSRETLVPHPRLQRQARAVEPANVIGLRNPDVSALPEGTDAPPHGRGPPHAIRLRKSLGENRTGMFHVKRAETVTGPLLRCFT